MVCGIGFRLRFLCS